MSKQNKPQNKDVFDDLLDALFRLIDLLFVGLWKALSLLGGMVLKKIKGRKKSDIRKDEEGLSDDAKEIVSAHRRMKRRNDANNI